MKQTLRIVESPAAELRLAQVRRFLDTTLGGPGGGEVVIVCASRGAADDLARSIAAARPATLGLHRFSFTQLAARLAAPVLAAHGMAPATYLGAEAVAARAAFDAQRAGDLSYFGPVSDAPGFPRALARTLQELRLAQVGAGALSALSSAGPDLAALLERFDAQFAAASATDRATLFDSACEGVALGATAPVGSPLVFVDVPLESAAEFAFFRALVHASPEVLITVPFGDVAALDRLKAFGVEPEVLEHRGTSDLVALRRYLFASSQPPERSPVGDVTLFSAPGEGREAVEIARRILEEARHGVRLDEIAVLLRSPRNYLGLLEQAFVRAGIPAWFDRGIRRPHPAGRAFLAILACAVEKLSARRFAEYLSLAQVPAGTTDTGHTFVPPQDEVFGSATAPAVDEAAEADGDERASAEHDETSAVVDGTLRAPWKWERLIVESSVIGGADRWHRRLDGSRGGDAAAPPRRVERRSRFAGRCRTAPRSSQPRAPAALRAAGRGYAGGRGRRRRRGASGSITSPRSCRVYCVIPRKCCACSASCGRWPTSVRSRWMKCATCWPNACSRCSGSRGGRGSAPCSSAARTRRAAARSASSSCRAWRSGCSRRSRAKIRCSSTTCGAR